jgi:hypothetical protein
MPKLRSAASLLASALVLAACGGDGTGPTPRPAASCTATDSTVAVTAMAVGEFRAFAGNTLNCVRVPGSGARYISIVANVGRSREVAAQAFRFSANGVSPAAGLLSTRVAASVLDDAGSPGALDPVHERLMLEARRLDLAAARDARQAARTQPRLASGVRGAIFPSGTTPTVGTTATVRVPSLAAGDRPCDVFSTVTATVRHVSTRSIILVDNSAPATGFSDADLQAISAEFDQLIYDTDIAYFGSGSDEDANGRIVMLYTPKVNEATPRGSQSLLAGFFWAGDLIPRGSCNQSNGSELFYLLVPDPAGVFSSPRTVADVREKTRGTIAHEFQHMLNAGWRFTNNASEFEAVWLDEALSHFAEEAVGRAKLGVGDFVELTHAQIFDAGNGLRDYNAFFFQNLVRFEDWLRTPNTKSPMSEQADTSLAVRGAGWAMLRYTIDHFSGGDARAFTRSLVQARTDTGTANLQARLGGAVRLDSAVTGWMVASYADNLSISGAGPRTQYTSWNMRDAVAQAIRAGYPLTVTQFNGDAQVTGNVRSGGGATYYDVPAARANLAVQVSSSDGATVGFPDARLVLFRVQ